MIDEPGEREPDENLELRNFAERLQAGDESLLDEAEEESGAFVGEELRRMIDRAASEGEIARVLALPWGIGACFRQTPEGRSLGPPGIFFATRTKPMADAEYGFRYWRHVPFAADEDGRREPIALDLEILRVIDPAGGTPVDSLDDVDLETAWQIAVHSIVEAHNERSDLRARQEPVGPRQRWALELVRDPTVALPSLDRAERAIAALSVERSSAVRRALGQVYEQLEAGEISRNEAAAGVLDTVDAFGLRRVETLPPVEKIIGDDLGVVCWMAVLGPGS